MIRVRCVCGVAIDIPQGTSHTSCPVCGENIRLLSNATPRSPQRQELRQEAGATAGKTTATRIARRPWRKMRAVAMMVVSIVLTIASIPLWLSERSPDEPEAEIPTQGTHSERGDIRRDVPGSSWNPAPVPGRRSPAEIPPRTGETPPPQARHPSSRPIVQAPREGESLEELYERLKSLVVLIETTGRIRSRGTGFFIRREGGEILTNYHVIEDAEHRNVHLRITLPDTGDRYDEEEIRVLHLDPARDLALILIPGLDRGAPPLEEAKDDPDTWELFGEGVRHGQEVFTIGNSGTTTRTITRGIVSNTQVPLNGIPFLQTDTAVNPGNSGGPLLNMRGGIVGIVSQKTVASDVDNVGFALPSSEILSFLRQKPRTRHSAERPNNSGSQDEQDEGARSIEDWYRRFQEWSEVPRSEWERWRRHAGQEDARQGEEEPVEVPVEERLRPFFPINREARELARSIRGIQEDIRVGTPRTRDYRSDDRTQRDRFRELEQRRNELARELRDKSEGLRPFLDEEAKSFLADRGYFDVGTHWETYEDRMNEILRVSGRILRLTEQIDQTGPYDDPRDRSRLSERRNRLLNEERSAWRSILRSLTQEDPGIVSYLEEQGCRRDGLGWVR